MSTTESVFDETTPLASATPTPVTPADGTENPTFNSLVGEGKKFKDIEALAKSKLEADTFINRLTDEAKELRKDLESRIRAEEAIESLKQERLDKAPSKSVDAKELTKVVTETIAQVERDKMALTNIREANSYLIDKLGSKEQAEAFVSKKATELGVPMDWLKDMAARSPKALYNTLGVDVPVAAPIAGVTQGDINTVARSVSVPSTSGKVSKEAYDKLRKEKPSEYWSTKIQNEIFAATKKGLYQ
jgi:hypothetical protein